MFERKKIYAVIKHSLWVELIVAALVILGLSFFSNRGSDVTTVTARRVEKILDRRMSILQDYMREVYEDNSDEWHELKNLPSDMVVYHYVNDTLKSWNNQFTVDNDDVSQKVSIPRFSNLRYSLVSPLAEVDTVVSYMNLGPKWYLVKSINDGNGNEVIGGLMVRNTMDMNSLNGVNRRLKVSGRFSLYPVSYSGGSSVSVEGIPLIKVIQENASVIPMMPDPWAIWLSVFMVFAGIGLLLSRKRTRGRMWMSMGLATIVGAVFFVLGYGMRTIAPVFSPMVYADGGFLYSLGAVLIINIWIVSLVSCIFSTRIAWLRYIHEGKSRYRTSVFTISIVLLMALIAGYIHLTFRSIIINSNISLELFQVGQITWNTVYVYLSYLVLMLALLLLLQLLLMVVREKTGRRYNIFSRIGRICMALLATLYLVVMSSSLSFKREEGRAEIWANRLSIDRNLAFEIQLRSIEGAIANDGLIPSLIALEGDFHVILNRVSENYLSRVSNDYDVDLYMFRDSDADSNILRYFNERMQNGSPLADNSRFMYSRSAVGRAQYTGIFTYYNANIGLVRLLIGIESKADSEKKGYDAVINSTRPGSVSLPPQYSYGKYLNEKLVGYRGDYAYPTILTGRLLKAVDPDGINAVNIDNYVHFVSSVSNDEVVVISRKKNEVTRYVVAAFMILLLAFMMFSIPGMGSRKREPFEKNYYKQRINSLLFLSLTATLIAMTSVSVLFIYRRNTSNLNDLMAGKINTIQSLVEADSRYFQTSMEFDTNEFRNELENIGTFTKSDITVFATDGKVLMSTYPELYERLSFGTRLNGESYRNIIYNNKRYYINKEKIEGRSIYTMSAPVFNSDGTMLAIVSAPYTDAGLSFKYDALFHAAFVITIFFILLIMTHLFCGKVVDKMFSPLIEMGKKMKQAKTSGLEYIIYQRDDEIATLVDSYNRMVHDLYESSKQAAQVERDKAWSEMARQVAHEIKNPLTPIQLQIQRIMRLKSKNDPTWPEKFDTIAPIVLDSINRLAETANEFSTFAKLYGEEHVDIDLDKLASDQLALFGDKDNISMQYLGLKDVTISGPKPQLTRVIVNLLTNSVQAIEGMQREQAGNGEEPVKGQILLSIRNSNHDGYYDIVFEDNGPGVKDEDRNRLFTPNFTTKSSGTGLGLAISKNILERCGGEIFYSRSFTLGGACFTIRYPKPRN